MVNANRLAPFLALLLSAPFGWMACNSLLGIEEPELRVDAGPSSDTGTTSDAGDSGCVLAKVPEAPTTEDPSSAPDQTFVTAIRAIGMSLDPPAPLTGYDIDGRCTCPSKGEGPESCVAPPKYNKTEHCDDPGGRDLSLNRAVVSLLLSTPGFSIDDLNKGFEEGRFGVLAYVRNYNGTPNDREVEVALVLSSGYANATGKPAWDGTDKWDLEPTSLDTTVDAGTPIPLYVDKTAYVRDGILVASKLNTIKLTLGFGASSLKLEVASAAVTAKIEKRGTGFTLTNGVVVGRLPAAALLKAVGPLSVPAALGGGVVCSPAGKGFYDLAVKSRICGAADVSSNPARDSIPTATCDALSFGMRFESEPAAFGIVRSTPPVDAGCPASWGTDDCLK